MMAIQTTAFSYAEYTIIQVELQSVQKKREDFNLTSWAQRLGRSVALQSAVLVDDRGRCYNNVNFLDLLG